MKPNSILKSPSELKDLKVPPSSLKRRVSFGPQQIHEFSVETTFSQGTSSLQSSSNASTLPHSQHYSCNEESTKLTETPFNVVDGKIDSDQFTEPRSAPNVHSIRSLPIQDPTMGPLESWNLNSNSQVPFDPLNSGDKHCGKDSIRTEELSNKPTRTSKRIDYSEVSMEFTCAGPSNDVLSKVIESEQPNHFSPNPVDTSRMSWHAYNTSYFDVNQTPDQTLDTHPMLNDTVDAPLDTSLVPPDTSWMLPNSSFMPPDIESDTPTINRPPSNMVLYFSGFTDRDKLKYKKYLLHKAKIAELRPEVRHILRDIEALKQEKSRLENEISSGVMEVAEMKERLTVKKDEIERKREAIRQDIRSRLLSLKEKCLKVMNS